MTVKSEYLAVVDKLFRTRTVVLHDDLRRALKVQSRVTAFHVLKAMGYYNSYSHGGRYCVLERIPKFDDRGLWHFRDIGFSRHGTLRATIVYLVDHAPAGYTHQELESILKLRVHNTLLLLVEADQLQRETVADIYVYCSAHRARAVQQLVERRKLTPPPVENADVPLPGQLAPAVLIDLLLDFIRHPEHDTKAVCRQLASLGHWITPVQVEDVFRHFGLKKTLPSRSRRSRR
ncbi:MAG TPA: hypothetical protein VI320_13530 [Terracidiphilus sp.]|jgi:hypothetical protein